MILESDRNPSSKEMFYSIVEPFSPEDGDKWTGYCAWRGVKFTSFDSVDGMMRPKLFRLPEEDGDWSYVTVDDGLFHLIKDYDFALKQRKVLGRGDIVGLRLKSHDEEHPDFLGFELLDSFHDISLLTNWGNDTAIINGALAPNGLVREWSVIKAIQTYLNANHSDDGHVEGCRIISIYRVEGNGESPG